MQNTESAKIIDPDAIDWPATKHAMRLYKIAAVSRDMGEINGTLTMVLNGKYPPGGKVFSRIVGKLQDRGFLVLKQKPEQKTA